MILFPSNFSGRFRGRGTGKILCTVARCHPGRPPSVSIEFGPKYPPLHMPLRNNIVVTRSIYVYMYNIIVIKFRKCHVAVRGKHEMKFKKNMETGFFI